MTVEFSVLGGTIIPCPARLREHDMTKRGYGECKTWKVRKSTMTHCPPDTTWTHSGAAVVTCIEPTQDWALHHSIEDEAYCPGAPTLSRGATGDLST